MLPVEVGAYANQRIPFRALWDFSLTGDGDSTIFEILGCSRTILESTKENQSEANEAITDEVQNKRAVM